MSRPASVAIRPGAFSRNLATLRRLAPDALFMAVVKADAYGHGVGALSSVLGNADALAVASLDEAQVLREAGITAPVVLLEGIFEPAELPRATSLDCDLVVHSPWQIEALEGAAGRHVVWLKLDTGMNRLGFRGDEAAAARDRLSRCAAVKDLRLMTHLACADTRTSDMTHEQLARFEAATMGWIGARSIANSAGLLAWPAAHADWVRPGLALYGISPFAGEDGSAHGLEPVMELRSALIAVREVRAGESVGYGAAWTAVENTRIGIVGIGYGDGYPRQVSPGTPVLVNGQQVPLVGHVSMDMLAVDLRSRDDAGIGAPVVLWGGGLPVEEIARSAGTIPWTLLCGVSERVARQVTS